MAFLGGNYVHVILPAGFGKSLICQLALLVVSKTAITVFASSGLYFTSNNGILHLTTGLTGLICHVKHAFNI